MIELLYFTAPWCGPCKMMKPIIEELQTEGYNVTKIDVDMERSTANQFGVLAMPTFIVLKDGNIINRATGARNKESLLQLLHSVP